MRIHSLGWGDRMLPLFLHFGVHDQERVVGQVDGNLALYIRSALWRKRIWFFVLGSNASNSEFACDTER
jgi:hypothetical protein